MVDLTTLAAGFCGSSVCFSAVALIDATSTIALVISGVNAVGAFITGYAAVRGIRKPRKGTRV